eukprot:TRINITY_DN3255_c0_g1_i3.p1 TRINITY_DN3255_c0_g1~~TRINITY_DN3255_c0_g1_i3.p1  ORF type:complete len:105 (+),score=6.02 TRINITY_DN3255_c0_g1_i3:541-855(+)
MIPNISIAPIGLGEVRLLERFSIKKDTISSDFDPSDLTQRWIFVAQHRCPNTFRCIYLDTFKYRFITYQYPMYSALILSLIHISEPTRLLSISYAVFCLKKKKG